MSAGDDSDSGGFHGSAGVDHELCEYVATDACAPQRVRIEGLSRALDVASLRIDVAGEQYVVSLDERLHIDCWLRRSRRRTATRVRWTRPDGDDTTLLQAPRANQLHRNRRGTGVHLDSLDALEVHHVQIEGTGAG